MFFLNELHCAGVTGEVLSRRKVLISPSNYSMTYVVNRVKTVLITSLLLLSGNVFRDLILVLEPSTDYGHFEP